MACQQKPHCKQGTWRAGIYFPLEKLLRREFNKCRPFYLWLLPFLEKNLNSELFKTFILPTYPHMTLIICLCFPHSPPMAKLDNCVLSLFACTAIQDGPPGLTNTQAYPICARPLEHPNCHLFQWRNQTTIFYKLPWKLSAFNETSLNNFQLRSLHC